MCTSNNSKCAKRAVEQACVYCTSNNRKCAKRSQQSCNRLVCIVRVITVSVRSVLNNCGLCVLYDTLKPDFLI